MADSESFPHHHHHYLGSATNTATTTTSSFSQLLFCNDLDGDNCDNVVLAGPDDIDQTFHYSSIGKPPMMLCFGGYIENEGDQVVLFGSSTGNFNDATKVVTTPQKPGVSTCSETSSASSAPTVNHRVVANPPAAAEPNRKRDGSNQEAVQRPSTSVKATRASQRTSNKKTKMENPTATGNPRGRREKLGERITALQQLVSPFGKTDTASVLHEAMGYIRFLHDQVQVLCSPYLQHQPEVEEYGEGEELRKDLKSRGLCLVPVECTVQVSSTNGADYWSPAAAINDSSTAINYQVVNQN